MTSITNLLGLILIVLGIGVLAYQGFTYTKHETVAQIGTVQVTANTQKTVYFPPILGGASLVAGIILIVVGKRK